MKKNIILSACVAVAMAFSLPSHAQRLVPGQMGIELVGGVPLIKGEKLFAKDNFGFYRKRARISSATWGFLRSAVMRS